MQSVNDKNVKSRFLSMIRLLVAGDYSPMLRVADLIEKGREDEIFGEVKELTGRMDYSVVNFESTVTDGKDEAIKKSGPNLSCSATTVETIRNAGFDMVTLANNHFADYGDRAVGESLKAIKTAGLDHVGGGKNIHEAEITLFKKIKDKTFAFINCCEHEFSIADEDKGGSNPLVPIRQYYKITEAREKADYVIVIVHGGHEHFQLPSLRMQETYRFFIDAGADVVVNHHQHCFSGYEYYHGKPIAYGLGNFCFDNGTDKPQTWFEGFALELSFEDGKIGLQTYPYVQCKEKASVSFLKDRSEFDKRIKELNAVIADKNKLKEALCKYYDVECRRVVDIGEPWPRLYRLFNNKLKMHVFPIFTYLKRFPFRNVVCCEAHLDKFRYAMEKLIKGEF